MAKLRSSRMPTLYVPVKGGLKLEVLGGGYKPSSKHGTGLTGKCNACMFYYIYTAHKVG